MSDSHRKTVAVGMLLDLALLGWGAYRLYEGADAAGYWKWIYVLAVVVGGYMLVRDGLAFFLGTSPDQGGQDMHRMNTEIYSGEHEYRTAGASDFKGLDVAFYEQTTRQLQQLGFRHLADMVDVTMERATPWGRTVLRSLLSEDQQTMGGVFDVHLSGKMRLFQLVGLLSRDMRSVDFESELSDGTFVTTGTESDAALASEFPGISRRFLPRETPVGELYDYHKRHVEEVLGRKPGVTVRRMESLQDCIASGNRMMVHKSEHRNSSAFDPVAEVERIARRPLTEEQRAAAEGWRELHDRQEGRG